MALTKEKQKQVEEELKNLAKNNWDEFAKLIELNLENFVICEKKKRGNSLRQISAITGISKDKVSRVICKICPPNS